ncbi:MAG: hypothetical protein IH626_07925 [Rhodospirillales bacterium]|nr:hypothetical protein [Rhodospirillales bacterium]
MGFSLVLEILVAGLLVVTISYTVMLNRRLRTMRQDKLALEKLATKFVDSTMRAEESITRLKATADELKERIDRAQGLRDDLAFLTERGGSAADRLESLVRVARKEAPAEQPHASAKGGGRSSAPADDAKSDAERELIKALRAAR